MHILSHYNNYYTIFTIIYQGFFQIFPQKNSTKTPQKHTKTPHFKKTQKIQIFLKKGLTKQIGYGMIYRRLKKTAQIDLN